METWTWQVLLLLTIKLHGTKTRTAKALLEVNRSCRRVRMVLQSVFAADLDGDGDMDLASASSFDDKIAWYKNLVGYVKCYGTGTQRAVSLDEVKYHDRVYVTENSSLKPYHR